MELFDASKMFGGFKYPSELERLTELGFVDFGDWFIMDAPYAERYCFALKERYPGRSLVPFAKRSDNDDVACFEVGKPNKVEIIHDFAEPGWEQRYEYQNIALWLKDVVCEFIDRTREESAEAL